MTDTRRALRAVLVASLISVACSQYYAANQQQARYYYIPQQAQYQQWQLAQQQQRYAYQQQFYAPRPAPPTAVQPPLQQALQPAAPVRQPAEKKATTRVSNVYEFDLPPAPPSRFLSEDDRSKILSVNKHGRPEHVGNSPTQVRSRLVNGATERQTPDGVSRQQPQAPPPPPPPIQVHHLQLPRFIPKPVVQTPSQITHLLGSTAPPLVVVTTRSTPPAELVHVTEAPLEPTTTVSHLSPLREKKVDPNKIFLQCCQNKKVAKVCEAKCNFMGVNKKALTAMFLGTDPCPQRYGLDLFSCAAQDSDHTACCRAKNVGRTSAGDKCLAFCNLTPDAHFKADASYLPCWGVLHDIKDCFKDAIITNGGPLV